MRRQHKHPNELRYLVPPTHEQIMKVVEAHGVAAKQFERFYGIFECAIYRTKPELKFYKPLPTKHWHIIYEALERIENNQPIVVQHKSFSRKPFTNPKKKKKNKPRTPSVQRTGIIADLL